MVAKIRLEAEDATGAAFQSVVQNTNAAEQALGGVGAAMDKASADSERLDGKLNSAEDTVREVTETFAALNQRLDNLAEAEYKAAAAAGRAAHGIDNTGDEAKEAAAQIDKMKSALDRTSDSSGSFMESMAKVWALKEGFAKLVQGINYLADQGDPAFMRLRESGLELVEALIKITEQEEVQRFVENLATAFSNTAEFIAENAHYVGELIEAVREYFEWMVEGYTRVAEFVGMVAEGTTEELRNMKKLEEAERSRAEQSYAAKKAAAEAQRQRSTADKIEADFIKAQQNADELAATKKIENARELEIMQSDELDRIKKLAEQGKLTTEEQIDSQRRLQAWENRKEEIWREEEERTRKAHEAAVKQAEEIKQLEKEAVERTSKISQEEEDSRKSEAEQLRQRIREKEEADKEAAKAEEELIKKAAKVKEEAEKQAAADAKAANDEKLREFEQHVAKLQAAVDSTKQADGSKVDAGLREATSGKNLVNEVVRKRQDAAEDELRAQYAASGRSDTGKDFEAEAARLRKNVQKETMKQANRGEISPEEYGKAQGDLANRIIDQGQASGKLGKNAAAALREQAQALAKQNTETERLAMELEEIRSFSQQLNNGSQRRQAQRKRS